MSKSTLPSEIALPENLRRLYPFASHYRETPWGRQHYLDEGSGTPILMLHGNPTWSFFYRGLVEAMRGSYRCVVPDHLGMGLSDKPQEGFGYRLQDHLEQTVALVEALDLKHFHLLVHDWGGAIGMGLAERFPDRVEKIVVMNSAAFRSQHIPLRIAFCRAPLIGPMLVRRWNRFAEAATRMAVTRPLSPEVREGYLFPYQTQDDRIGIHRFVQDIPMERHHPSYETIYKIERGLADLRSKSLLLLWGMRDFCFRDIFLREWQQHFPEAQTCQLEEAGHYLLEDEPEACLKAIESFLGDRTATSE